MLRRLAVLGLALAACGDPKTERAHSVETIAYVASATPPRLVLSESTRVNTGGRSKRAKFRLDVRDAQTGKQTGVYVFERGEQRGAWCFPGQSASVWCWTNSEHRLQTRDLETFELEADIDALTARFPALEDGLVNRSPTAVPGTGEVIVETGRGETWILGDDPIKDDGGEAYKRRARGEFAEEPQRFFSLSKHGEFVNLSIEREYVPTDVSADGVKTAAVVRDRASNELIIYEAEQVVVGRVEGDDGAQRLAAFGFDASTKWTTDLGNVTISSAARMPDAVALVLATPERQFKLSCFGITDGAIRWSHDL